MSAETRATLPPELLEYLSSSDFAEMCESEFKLLDADDSGALEPDELVPALMNLFETFDRSGPAEGGAPTPEQCLEFAAVFDTSGECGWVYVSVGGCVCGWMDGCVSRRTSASN